MVYLTQAILSQLLSHARRNDCPDLEKQRHQPIYSFTLRVLIENWEAKQSRNLRVQGWKKSPIHREDLSGIFHWSSWKIGCITNILKVGKEYIKIFDFI